MLEIRQGRYIKECMQARKARQQRLKELEELSECTFQPELVSQQLAGSGKVVRLAQSLTAPCAADSAHDGNLFDCSGRQLDSVPSGASKPWVVPSMQAGKRGHAAGAVACASAALFDLVQSAAGPEDLYEEDEVRKLLAATALTSAASASLGGSIPDVGRTNES